MINFRTATTADIAAIASLHAESWRKHYRGIWRDAYLDGPVYEDRAKVWRERLESPKSNQHILLAMANDALVGFACFYLDDDPVFGTLLDNLHVVSDQQGGGIGTQLIRAAAAVAHGHDPDSKFYLWVLEANHKARGFYEHLGANHHETVQLEEPDGGASSVCRYVWSKASDLMTQALQQS